MSSIFPEQLRFPLQIYFINHPRPLLIEWNFHPVPLIQITRVDDRTSLAESDLLKISWVGPLKAWIQANLKEWLTPLVPPNSGPLDYLSGFLRLNSRWEADLEIKLQRGKEIVADFDLTKTPVQVMYQDPLWELENRPIPVSLDSIPILAENKHSSVYYPFQSEVKWRTYPSLTVDFPEISFYTNLLNSPVEESLRRTFRVQFKAWTLNWLKVNEDFLANLRAKQQPKARLERKSLNGRLTFNWPDKLTARIHWQANIGETLRCRLKYYVDEHCTV